MKTKDKIILRVYADGRVEGNAFENLEKFNQSRTPDLLLERDRRHQEDLQHVLKCVQLQEKAKKRKRTGG